MSKGRAACKRGVIRVNFCLCETHEKANSSKVTSFRDYSPMSEEEDNIPLSSGPRISRREQRFKRRASYRDCLRRSEAFIMSQMRDKGERSGRGKARVETARARAHCPIRVSLIKRSNRACYVSCMKIYHSMSHSGNRLRNFFAREENLSFVLSTVEKKRRKKKKKKETASVFYLPQTLTHVALIRATRNR